MRVPEVRTCCCGCTLETGSTIIAWLEIVCGVLSVIGGIFGAISKDYPVSDAVYTLIVGIVTLVCGIILLKGVKGRIVKNVHLWVMISTVVLVVNIIFFAIQFIVLLVNGAVGNAFSALIGGLIGVLIYAYLIIVVFNFKREIGSDGQPA